MPGTLTYKQALKNASVICSKSEKCSSEIIASFRQWGLTEEEISTGIDYLKKEIFIDDQRYAANFVHDKFRFNKWGKIKIAYMLRQKRIAESLIADALENIPEEDYEATIRELLRSKVKSIR